MKINMRSLVFVVAGLLMAAYLYARSAELVASRNSDRYHLSDCKIASKIRTEDKQSFQSAADAESAGYGPCKKCFPKSVTGNFSIKKE